MGMGTSRRALLHEVKKEMPIKSSPGKIQIRHKHSMHVSIATIFAPRDEINY